MRRNLFFTVFCTIVLCACNNDDGWRVLGEKDETTLYIESILESQTNEEDLEKLNSKIGTTSFFVVMEYVYLRSEERWIECEQTNREIREILYFEQDFCYRYHWETMDFDCPDSPGGDISAFRRLVCEKYEYSINVTEEGIMLEFKPKHAEVDKLCARLVSIDKNQAIFVGATPFEDYDYTKERLPLVVYGFEFNDTIRAEWDSILAEQDVEK